MMKKLLFVLVFGLVAGASYGQATGSEYRTAAGVKVWPGGITVKHFIKDQVALEGIAYFWDYGFRFTGLYEFHGDINGAQGLKCISDLVRILADMIATGKTVTIATMELILEWTEYWDWITKSKVLLSISASTGSLLSLSSAEQISGAGADWELGLHSNNVKR
jgi:hypothetical protein